MMDLKHNIFDALSDEDIPKGTVVILVDGTPFYVGPLVEATPKHGCTMVMHPDDFADLRTIVMKARGKYH